MQKILSQEEIKKVLYKAFHGHLGCADGRNVYVVPINFAYDGEFIISHTGEGKKVEIMRVEPKVCFQVEIITSPGNWKSVIVYGTFEEVDDEEIRKKYMQLLLKKVLPEVPQAMTRPHEPAGSLDRREAEGLSEIIYRIRINEMTGRFQKT